VLLKETLEIIDGFTKSIPQKTDYNDGDSLNASKCFFCQKDFKEYEYKKPLYCFFSHNYFGATHEGCSHNHDIRKLKMIPFFFHNFKVNIQN